MAGSLTWSYLPRAGGRSGGLALISCRIDPRPTTALSSPLGSDARPISSPIQNSAAFAR
jgi:hypothetical protein